MKTKIYLKYVACIFTFTTLLMSSQKVAGQTPSSAKTSINALTYCAANGKSAYYEYIDYVAIGAINRTSGAEPGGYFDGTALSTNIAVGSKNAITLSHANPRGGYVENWQVFIDWNADGDFVDAGEKALTAVTYTAGNYTDSIQVPANAVPGPTRMRIMMSSNLYPFPKPCGSFQYGEVEDYTVNIIASTSCSESYEPNNKISKAKPIPVNTNILSQISTSTDKDWFSFTNTATAPNIKITLSSLPADYNLQLYDSAGTLIKTSANVGTADETIVYNALSTGIWKVKVYGARGTFSNTQCYTLLAAVSTTPNAASALAGITNQSGEGQVSTYQNTNTKSLTIYPNPASGNISLLFNYGHNENVQILVYDLSGHIVQQGRKDVLKGKNEIRYNIEKLLPGFYHIKIAGANEQLNGKLIVR